MPEINENFTKNLNEKPDYYEKAKLIASQLFSLYDYDQVSKFIDKSSPEKVPEEEKQRYFLIQSAISFRLLLLTKSIVKSLDDEGFDRFQPSTLVLTLEHQLQLLTDIKSFMDGVRETVHPTKLHRMEYMADKITQNLFISLCFLDKNYKPFFDIDEKIKKYRANLPTDLGEISDVLYEDVIDLLKKYDEGFFESNDPLDYLAQKAQKKQ